MCVSTCEFVHMGEVFWGVSEPLEMELQTAVSYMKWVQGPKLRPPRRAEGSLKGLAIPQCYFKADVFINFGICP